MAVHQDYNPSNHVEYTGNAVVPTGTPGKNIDTRVLSNGDRYDWDGSAWVQQLSGGSGISYYSHAITWHHDATQPSKEAFKIDLTSKRLGDSGWLGDKFAHPYYGPNGAVNLKMIYSNDGPAATLIIQELKDSQFNTNFSSTPLTGSIGTAVLAANTNGIVTIPITPTAGNGTVDSSIFYYWVNEAVGAGQANKVRIMSIKVTP